ncbi:hypothetical protein ACLBXM_03065 [Xanthobacteraceae bacterium A53D]
MNWTIVPYKSVGPLRFDMTPDEVAEQLGPPETVSAAMPAGASQELQEKYADHTVEFRLGRSGYEAKPTVRYEAGKAASFDLFDTLKTAEIDGFKLFEHSKRDALQKLKRESKLYVEEVDGYVFFDLGISISNDDMWEDSPPINVFAKGQFDDLLEAAEDDEDIKLVRK